VHPRWKTELSTRHSPIVVVDLL